MANITNTKIRNEIRKKDNDKFNKKATVTFAIDENILKDIKNDALQDGLSLNGKINSILSKYSLCYKYIEKKVQ